MICCFRPRLLCFVGSKRSRTVLAEAKYDRQSPQEAKISGLDYTLWRLGGGQICCICHFLDIDWSTFRGSKSAIFIFTSLCFRGQLLRQKKKLLLFPLTLLHSERPKLYSILAFQSAIGSKVDPLFGELYHKGKPTECYKFDSLCKNGRAPTNL